MTNTTETPAYRKVNIDAYDEETFVDDKFELSSDKVSLFEKKLDSMRSKLKYLFLYSDTSLFSSAHLLNSITNDTAQCLSELLLDPPVSTGCEPIKVLLATRL